MATEITGAKVKELKGDGFLRNKNTDCFSARVITVNGRVTSEQVETLAEAAKKYGEGIVSLTSRLTFEIPGIQIDNIPAFKEFIAKAGLVTGGTGPKVRPIVSCKGTICHFGLIDTFALSERLHHEFYEGYRSAKMPYKFKITVGGCPNNCQKPNINDIGVVGARKPLPDYDKCASCAKCRVAEACPVGCAQIIDGRITMTDSCLSCGRCVGVCPFGVTAEHDDGMKVYMGGRWGKKVRMGTLIDHFFRTEDEVVDFIENTLLYYIENGLPGERLESTLDRLGFEDAEKRILAGEFLKRKDEILA
jgi:dissimilatory sulfite reductase (desulfoviridin) alpha/beta subunit